MTARAMPWFFVISDTSGSVASQHNFASAPHLHEFNLANFSLRWKLCNRNLELYAGECTEMPLRENRKVLNFVSFSTHLDTANTPQNDIIMLVQLMYTFAFTGAASNYITKIQIRLKKCPNGPHIFHSPQTHTHTHTHIRTSRFFGVYGDLARN